MTSMGARLRAPVLGFVFLAGAAHPPTAQVHDFDVHIDLILTPPSYDGCGAASFIDESTCLDEEHYDYTDGVAFLWIYITHTNPFPNGIGQTQFGIDHSGGWLAGWTLCAGGSEIAPTRESGSSSIRSCPTNSTSSTTPGSDGPSSPMLRRRVQN
jgi:hypothetical protein